MGISSIGNIGNSGYGQYQPYGLRDTRAGETDLGVDSANEAEKLPGLPGQHDKVHGDGECQTCKNRKYKDGSDEMVSFKTAQHISPESAAARVRAHEQEHVSNAYTEAAQKGGKVLRASVAIHLGVCPECGRTYVAGGVTNTAIKYSNEENPYVKDKKANDHDKFAGSHAEYEV